MGDQSKSVEVVIEKERGDKQIEPTQKVSEDIEGQTIALEVVMEKDQGDLKLNK